MLPFFYQQYFNEDVGSPLQLCEATSKHCIQVLRMQEGSNLLLTDGMGKKALCSIVQPDRKHSIVHIESLEIIEKSQPEFYLAIAFTKNKSRNEWLLEKVTELGVAQIIPIITQHSEKEKINYDRMNSILIAAMLQSQQYYLPKLLNATSLKAFIKNEAQQYNAEKKLIAHCLDNKKINYTHALEHGKNTLMLIGPEGDFAPEEVSLCLEAGYTPVSFGKKRFRTETAGMYACTVFNAINND